MNEDYKKLYDAVSGRFDIGDFESFSQKMQTPEDRKKFYDVVSNKGFDLGDYESYENRLSVGGDSVGKSEEVFGQDSETPTLLQRPQEEKNGTNREFPLTPEELYTPQDETPKEKPYFTGKFGGFLQLLDATSGVGLGDFIDDIGRAVDQGFQQGQITDDAITVMTKGKGSSTEDVQEYIEAVKKVNDFTPSDEFQSFRKIYEDGGKDVLSFMEGLAKNPTVVPELIINSFASLANPASGATAGGVVATGAAGGSVIPAAGTTAGALASVPYALGAANGVLETGLSFSEFLQEELGDKEFNEENIRVILEDEEALSRIRRKAITRGATIGVIDALTGRLAGRVGAKLATGTKASKIKSALTSTGIEATGGAGGEAAARGLVGQEMDVAEIGLEGISQVGMSAPSVAAELASKKEPSYKINGETVDKAEVQDIVENSEPSDLEKIDVEVSNDPELSSEIDNKIETEKIKQEVKKVAPDLSEQQVEKIAQIEKRIAELQESDLDIAKDEIKRLKEARDAVREQRQERTTVEQYGDEQKVETDKGTLKEGEKITYGEEGLEAEIVEDLGEEVSVKTEEGNEFIIPKEDINALQQVQGETEESVLRDQRMEKTSEEVAPQEEIDTEKEVTVEDTKPQDITEVKEETSTEGKKFRGFAQSITESALGQTEKKKIQENPENYYDPQSQQEIKEKAGQMSDEELLSKMTDDGLNLVKDGEDNFSVMAGIELINRKLAKGESIDATVESLSKKGTKYGQLIAQFAALNSSTPQGVMNTVNKIAEKEGKILSKGQKKKLQDLAKAMLESNAKIDQLLKEKGGQATDADIQNLKELQQQAIKDFKAFGDYTSAFTPMNWGQMLEMTLQGNLLTPMSQAVNVGANVAQQALLTPVTGIQGVVDSIVSLITGKRTSTFDPRVLKYKAIGAAKGLKEAYDTLIKGNQSEVLKGEVKRSFRPMTALAQALSDTPLGDKLGVEQGLLPKSLTKKGKEKLQEANRALEKGDEKTYENLRNEALKMSEVSMSDRAKKLYEASFGTPAEVMFRLLAFGDKPFYMSKVYASRFTEGKRKGLRGDQLRNYVMMPDKATQERINEEAKEVVFMEDGALSETATKITSSISNQLRERGNKVARGLGDALAFIFRTNVPYVKTPSNIISQTIDFAVPPVSLAKAISAYSKGDQKQGNKNLATAITGAMMGQAAAYLIGNGLVSSALDWKDEDERNIKYKVFNPNHLNISAMTRGMVGDSTDFQEGDTTIDLRKLGILGSIILVKSNAYNRLGKDEKKKETVINYKEPSTLFRGLEEYVGSIPDVLQYSFEQSFLAGTASLLEALKGGERGVEKWLNQMFRAGMSVPLPNTLTSITRATDTYLFDTKTEEVTEMFEYAIRERLGFLVPEGTKFSDYPVKVDMWGDKIERTPAGKNPYAHQFLDITKSNEIPNDPLSLEVYNLYSLTHNNKVVPNMPKRYIMDNGKKVEFYKDKEHNELYNEYASEVQKLKRKLAEKEYKKTSYKRASIEDKAERLGYAMNKYSSSNEYKKIKKKYVEKLLSIEY